MKLPDFELERFFARWEFSVRHLLCASDVEAYRLPELLSLMDPEIRSLWDSLSLGYTESAGHPLLREAIASLYDDVAPDQVLVHAGAQEAIFAFCNVAVGPGDHVIVTSPSYQSLHEVVRAAGADVEMLHLRFEEGWVVDLPLLRSMLRPSTRAIIVNFPHNPTGALPDAQTWNELMETAAEAGAWLFSDEVYRGLEHTGEALPTAADACPTGLSLGVMSKAFALAGLRIGWIACRDRALLSRLAAFKDYLTICGSAPSELLAIAALRARQQVLERSRAIVSANLALLDSFFALHADRVAWVRPRAGTTAFPRLLTSTDVESFGERLLRREGVLLMPGSLFEYPGNHFRLGFGRADFPAALQAMGRQLEGA
jgi:aspartate/methionine/tyrosine aminotransferase